MAAQAATDRQEQPVTMDKLGTILGAAATRRVEVKRTFAVPIEDVWDALVDPEAVSQWFAPATIEPREGGRIELRFGEHTVVTGTIKTFMPPNVFAYTWEQQGETTSLVQFDLIETAADETLMTVVQTALDVGVAADVAAGWHDMLDRLSQYSRTREIVPQDKARWRALYAAYQSMME